MVRLVLITTQRPSVIRVLEKFRVFRGDPVSKVHVTRNIDPMYIITVSQLWNHLESYAWSTLQKICDLMVMSSVLNADVAVIQNVAIVMYHCELLSLHHMKGCFLLFW